MKDSIDESDFSLLLENLSVIRDLMLQISSMDAYVNFLPAWFQLQTMMTKQKIEIIRLKRLMGY